MTPALWEVRRSITVSCPNVTACFKMLSLPHPSFMCRKSPLKLAASLVQDLPQDFRFRFTTLESKNPETEENQWLRENSVRKDRHQKDLMKR